MQQRIQETLQYLLSIPAKSWQTVESWDETSPQNTKVLHVVFPAFMLLHCTKLASATPEVQQWRENIAQWLLNQQSKDRTYNWWAANAPEKKLRPYPDDLDDTFCAWDAIRQTLPEKVTGEVYTMLSSVLWKAEKSPGGPYRTWHTASKQTGWRDYDPVVNCNIAYFLAYDGVFLEKQLKFIAQQFNKNTISPYYPSFFACAYFFSRMFSTLPQKGKDICAETARHVEKRLLSLLDHSPTISFHDTALLLSSLLFLHHRSPRIQKLQKCLLQSKGKRGRGGLCIDLAKHGKVHVAGSHVVTAALCLEALLLAQQQEKAEQTSHIISSVFTSAGHMLPTKHKFLYKKAVAVLQTFRSDTHIVFAATLPFVCKTVFSKHDQPSLSLCRMLATANVLGCIAYTLLDRCIDNEPQSAQNLPLAALFMRTALDLYTKMCSLHEWHTYMEEVLYAADEAYLCEAYTHRISQKDLTAKSLGTALPLFALLYKNPQLDKRRISKLTTYVSSFLQAKQLNDDLHDWEKDYERRCFTPVVQHILRKAGKNTDMTTLRTVFWRDVLPKECSIIQTLLEKAKRALFSAKLPHPDPLLGLLDAAFSDFRKAKATMQRIADICQNTGQTVC